MFSGKREVKFVGGRVMKTGIAAFLTAAVCLYFDLPVIYAVITAIVSIEPTAADSIRKGAIRLPAAAIGAALALMFSFMFGETALTYGLAAVLTIIICHRFHLDAGTLVATLTAVIMIPEPTTHYIDAFFTRLGTTTIGIVLSTLVNFFIFPPKYHFMIQHRVKRLYDDTGALLQAAVQQVFKPKRSVAIMRRYQQLRKDLDRTFQLKQYQREEWKYRRHTLNDIRSFTRTQKKLEFLQIILYHIGNLQFVNVSKGELSDEEITLIDKVAQSMVTILQDPKHHITDDHFKAIEALDRDFREGYQQVTLPPGSKYHHHFSSRIVIIYELLALHDVMEELALLCQEEEKDAKRYV